MAGPEFVEVVVGANTTQLEASLERAGVVAESSAAKIKASYSEAGAAAAAAAAKAGASADEQAAAAGRAAAAQVDSNLRITRAQQVAADAAAKAAEAAGLSADEQVSAARRAAEAQAMLEEQSRATAVVAAEAGFAIGDSFDKGATKAGGAITKLGGRLSGWGVPFAGGLVAVGKGLDEADTKGQHLTKTMSALGGATLLGAGAAFAAVSAEGVHLAMGFQTSVAAISANSDIPIEAAKKIGDAFLDTAGYMTISGNEMAKAFAPVSGQLKITEGAALDTAQSLRFMKTAADLAEGSQTDLTTSTAALSQVMQSFHLPLTQATTAADLLFNVSRSLNVPIDSVSAAIDKLHGRLGILMPSMQDVGGLLIALGQHGIMGSRGIQVAQTALTRLTSGTQPVKTVLGELGVAIDNSHGKFIGMAALIDELRPKLEGLNQASQEVALTTLFGSSAWQVMGQIIGSGVPKFDQATDAATKMGTAHKAASLQAATLAGQFKILLASLTDVATKLGLVLIPVLNTLGQALSNTINWMEQHKAVAEALAATIGGVLSVAVAVFAEQKMVKFGQSIQRGVQDMGKLVSAVETGATKLLGLGTAADTATPQVAKTGAAASTAAPEVETLGTDASLAGPKIATLGTDASAAATSEAAAGTSAKVAAPEIASMGAASTSALAGLGPLLLAIVAFERLMSKSGQQNIINNLQGKNNPNSPLSQGLKQTYPQLFSGSSSGGSTTPAGNVLPSFTGGVESNNALNAGFSTGSLQISAQQKQFLASLSSGTGLNPQVLAAWLRNEEPATATNVGGPGMGLYNFLNVGNTDSGSFGTSNPQWSNPTTAGAATAAWLKGQWNDPGFGASSAGIQSIAGAAGKSPAQQIAAIQASGWASGGETALQSLYAMETGSAPAGGSSVFRPGVSAPPAGTTGLSTGTGTLTNPSIAAATQKTVDALNLALKNAIDKYGSAAGSAPSLQIKALADSFKAEIESLKEKFDKAAQGVSGPQLETLVTTDKGILQQDMATATKSLKNAATMESIDATLKKQVGSYQAAAQSASSSIVSSLDNHFANLVQTLEKGYTNVSQTTAVKQQLAAIENQAKAQVGLGTSGSSLLASIQSAVSGSSFTDLQQLTRTGHTRVSSAGGTEHLVTTPASQANLDYNKLVSELNATHSTVLHQLAAQLQATYKTAETAKNNILVADAKNEEAAATQKLTAIWQDNNDEMVQSIKDMAQSIQDSFAASAQALTDATQTMTDQAGGTSTIIADNAQTAVDKLGERGLYGLNLIAQQMTVAADQQKSLFDAQINALQQTVDTQTATQDALVAKAQQSLDNTTQTQDSLVSNATAHLDAVTATQNAAITLAQSKVNEGVVGAQAALSAVQGTAAAAEATAAQQLEQAQGAAGIAEAQANAALSGAQATAASVVGQAQAALANAQGAAQIAEAQSQAEIAIEKEESATQFAGSGTTVNIVGLPANDASAISDAVQWVFRGQYTSPASAG